MEPLEREVPLSLLLVPLEEEEPLEREELPLVPLEDFEGAMAACTDDGGHRERDQGLDRSNRGPGSADGFASSRRSCLQRFRGVPSGIRTCY